MTRWKSHKRSFVISAVLIVFSVVSFGAVQSANAATDPTDLVPKDCLFCVRINNLDNALGQVDMFLTGLFPVGVSMMAKMQLGQFLGGGQAQGIDTAGQFAIFAPIPGSPDPTAIGILVPVSDYQTFVSGNANVTAADAQGLSKIGPADSPMLVAREFAGYALVSPLGNEQALVGVAKPTATLSADLDATEKQRATTAPIWAYGNLVSTGKMFGPMLQAQLGQMKQMMASQEGPNGEAAAGAMDMYSTMLNTLLTEAKYASIALTPSMDKVSLSAVVASLPGSKMAEALQGSQQTPNAKLTGSLDNGSVVNMLAKNSSLFKKWNETYVNEMFPKLMGGQLTDAEIKEIQTMTQNAMEIFGGSIAMSVAPNTKSKIPVTLKYAAELKDATKFNQLMDQATKMMTSGSLGKFYEEMGMKMSFDLKRKVETYKGVAIDAIKFNMSPTDPTAPEAEKLKEILGDGLDIQMATTDGLLLYALDEDPSSVVHALIDKVKASDSSSVPSEVQAAMKLIPGSEEADMFLTLNVIRVMQIAKSVAPEEIPLSDGPLATQSNVALATKAKDGKASLDLAVPKQHVQEIMMIVMQMQQGM